MHRQTLQFSPSGAQYSKINHYGISKRFHSQQVKLLVNFNQNKLPTVMDPTKFQTSPWKFITTSLKPPARWGHSSCIVNDTLYIFGGYANSIFMKDFWRYSLIQKQWHQVITFGDVPACRSNATLCYDYFNGQLLLFGGGGANKRRFNTVSTLDLTSLHWFEIPPFESEAAPWERTYHVAQFKFPYLIIFGGQGADDLGDLWAYNVTNLTWQQIKINGKKPTPRRFHTSCIVEDQLYIYGGCHGKYNCLNDMYSKELKHVNQTRYQEIRHI